MSRKQPKNRAYLELSDADIRAMMKQAGEGADAALRALAERVAQNARASTAFKDSAGEKLGKHLRASIRVKKSRFEDGGYIVQATAPHAHLVEYGHMMVTHEGRTVGHVPARPFLRRALSEALSALEVEP